MTFSATTKSLNCSLCLVYSDSSNAFANDLKVFTHVHQRIEEHESIKIHYDCLNAFLSRKRSKSLETILQTQRREEVIL